MFKDAHAMTSVQVREARLVHHVAAAQSVQHVFLPEVQSIEGDITECNCTSVSRSADPCTMLLLHSASDMCIEGTG